MKHIALDFRPIDIADMKLIERNTMVRFTFLRTLLSFSAEIFWLQL